jgi:hypothetical protein
MNHACCVQLYKRAVLCKCSSRLGTSVMCMPRQALIQRLEQEGVAFRVGLFGRRLNHLKQPPCAKGCNPLP